MQSYIGVNKMWASRNLGNVGVAADFIFNLVREPTIPGTLGRLETYLPDMASHRGIYRSKAEVYLAYQSILKNASDLLKTQMTPLKQGQAK